MNTTYSMVRYLVRFAAALGLALAAAAPGRAQGPAGQPSAADIDAAIEQFQSQLAAGRYPTADMQQSWWKANGDPYVGFVNKYSGLSGSIVTVLLGGETEGAGALPTVSTALDQLGLATTVYDVAAKLCEGKPNSRTLAFLSGAKYYLGTVLSKRGAGGSLMNAGTGFIDYALTSLGEHAVELSDRKWWKAYCAYQEREGTVATWLPSMKEGVNLDALAARLDRFWLEAEDLRGEDFFKTNNPDCERDYRNRFIREKVLPELKSWADTERRKAVLALKAAIMQDAVKLQTARVRVVGGVRNCLESFSDPPMRYEVTVDQTKEKVQTTGGFEFAVPLRDLREGSVTVRITPVGTNHRWEVFAGSAGLTVAPGRPLACSPGVKIETWKDGTIVAHLPPFMVAGISGPWPKDSDLPPGRVAVPAMPADANEKIEAPALAARAGYQAKTVSFEEACGIIRAQNQALEAEASLQWAGMEARSRALKRNAELDAAPLSAQGKSDAANAVYRQAEEAARELRLLVEARRTQRETVAADLRRWMNEEEAAIRKRTQDIDARLTALNQEMRKAEAAYLAAENELTQIVGMIDEVAYMTTSSSARSETGDPMNEYVAQEALQGVAGPRDAGADPETLLAAKLAEAQTRIDAVWQRFLAQEQTFAGYRDRLLELNAEKGVLVKQVRGTVPADFVGGAGCMLPDYAISFLEQASAKMERVRTLAALRLDRRVKADAPRIEVSIQRRAARRGAVGRDLAALEALVAAPDFPTEAQAVAAGGEFTALNGRLQAYVGALAARIGRQTPAPAWPAGVLDDRGGDLAFLKGLEAGMLALAQRNQALCGDLLSGPRRVDTPLARAQALLENLSQKMNLMGNSDRERWQRASTRVFGVLGKRSSLYGLGSALETLQFLVPLGVTPEERVQGLATNVKTLAAGYRAAASAVAVAPPDNLPLAELDARVQKTAALLAPTATLGGVPRALCPVDLLEARAALRQAARKSGLFDQWRKRHELPAAPRSVSLLGRTCPLDGTLVRIGRAAVPAPTGPNLPGIIEGRVDGAPAEGLEASYFGPRFSKVSNGTLTLGVSLAEPFRPVLFDITLRAVDASGKSSWIEGDPTGFTLLIEP